MGSVAEMEAKTAIDLREKGFMKKQKKSLEMKRRDFLKASAVAGATGAAASLEKASGILEAAEGKKVYVVPNVATPNRPVIRNPEICIGCNTCVEVCQVDVYIPNPVKGKPPLNSIFHCSKECTSSANQQVSFSDSDEHPK
jgi:NAD-dependent dihydropyrimidine dehydrogenase PreA subunit